MGLFASLSISASLVLAPPAGSTLPEGPEPEAEGAAVGALSDGGEDRGAFELGLGSVVVGVGVGLIVLGSVELARARARREECSRPETYSFSCDLDPAGLIFASSALAFTFSVPTIVGGALLLNKGAKINRDYRAVQKAQLSLTIGASPSGRFRARGATFGARLRF